MAAPAAPPRPRHSPLGSGVREGSSPLNVSPRLDPPGNDSNARFASERQSFVRAHGRFSNARWHRRPPAPRPRIAGRSQGQLKAGPVEGSRAARTSHRRRGSANSFRSAAVTPQSALGRPRRGTARWETGTLGSAVLMTCSTMAPPKFRSATIRSGPVLVIGGHGEPAPLGGPKPCCAIGEHIPFAIGSEAGNHDANLV
jgi:hypothetical protein